MARRLSGDQRLGPARRVPPDDRGAAEPGSSRALLPEYLLADLIGKTLVEKTATKPDLIITDVPAALALRSRVEMPVVALRSATANPTEAFAFDHPRAAGGLLLPVRFATDRSAVVPVLDRVDTAVELAEPFARIREAIAEARKMGVTNRAAA
jgi:hypothetical protein